MLIDRFNRVHDYLRISLTDNCNLRCAYCMPEEHYEFTPMANLMQPREIETLSKIFVQEGVNKIRLTGGEPLIRKDAAEIIMSLSKLPVNLTLTTNGTRIHDFVTVLQKAGVKNLNISLDTLQPEKFLAITRRDQFHRVFSNIHLLLQNDFTVKVNVVVMKGVNDDEILKFLEWTKYEPVHVRFIEFMPFDGNRWSSKMVVTLSDILAHAAGEYQIQACEHEKNETAKKYMIPGHVGSFAVISTMSANFCGDCNRMRLTADGKMKNCLFSNGEADLLGALRRNEDPLPLIKDCIRRKAKELGGQFDADFEHLNASHLHNRTMISIGG